MNDAPTMKRRLVFGGFIGAVLSGLSIIGLAGFGIIPPEPSLGIVSFVASAIILGTGAWWWLRRRR